MLNFVGSRSADSNRGHSRAKLHAKTPEVKPMDDDMPEKIDAEFNKIVGKTIGAYQVVQAADRVTPIDKWLGWDDQIRNSVYVGQDAFVDPTNAANYVTIMLKKPIGIQFVENPVEEGHGVMVGDIKPGSPAYLCGLIYSGQHLIFADDSPVYGIPFDAAIQPIVEKDGYIKLTLFKGDAVYFYGDSRPPQEWIDGFREALMETEFDDEQ